MTATELIQYAVAIAGGGAGIKALEMLVDYSKRRKENFLEIKKINLEERVALTKIELDSEDKLRIELWERIKSLEARVTDLDRKEQECWDKYNLLFKSNAEIAAELNYVKTILHSSSSEMIKLLPVKKEEPKK